jgi:hypothetical protein
MRPMNPITRPNHSKPSCGSGGMRTWHFDEMAVLIAGRRFGSAERSTTRARFSSCWCNGGATPGRPRNSCANCSGSRALRLRRSSPIGPSGSAAVSGLRRVGPDSLWLPAVQRLRRSPALPSAERALRARQRHHHDQSQLRRVGHRVWRRQDDDCATRSSHSPLPHSRN